MQYLIVSSQGWIFVTQCIETMRAGSYYFCNTIVIKRFYIGQGLHLEKKLISSTLGRITCTALLCTKHSKRNPCLVKNLSKGLGYSACPLIKATCTTYPEKDIGLNPLCAKLRHSRNMKVHRHLIFQSAKVQKNND